MRVTALARASLVLSLVSACSFISARPPRAGRRPGQPPVCHSSSGSVAVDGLTAVAALAIAIGAPEDAGGAGGLVALLYGGSAVYGFSATKRCDEARVAYQDELQRPAVARRRDDDDEPPARPRPTATSVAPTRAATPTLPPASSLPDPYATPPTPPTPPAAPAATPTAAPRPPVATTPTAPRPAAVPPAGEDDEGEDGDTADAAADDADRWRAFWRRLP